MGASMSWLVAEEEQLDRIASILRLERRLGDVRAEDIDMEGVVTPGGKLFLFECGREEKLQSPDFQSLISAGTTVYFFSNLERVMFSSAEMWRDGKQVWMACHASDRGLRDLETEGDLPASFESIRARRFTEQDQHGGENADVDMIQEIPLDLADVLTGYDGGIDYPEGEGLYLVKQPRRGFFDRLFGRQRKLS